MKKQFKVVILIAMCLAVTAIYLGKNVYFKKESPKEQAKVESQKESVKDENSKEVTSNGPSLLEFSTETWPTCIQMVSVMEQVEKEYKGKAVVKILKVDESEENYNLATKYNIRVVPTLIFLNGDGTVYKRIEGFTTQKEIEEIFDKIGVKWWIT